MRVKFFTDKRRVIISLSNGTLMLYNTVDYQIMKVIVSKYAIVDSLKLLEDKYLITAGIDPKVRIWNLESEKILSKFKLH